MKKGIILIIGILLVPIVVMGKEYNNRKNDFRIEVPESYYVIDENNIEENRSFIESYGMFAEEVRNIFKGSDEVTLGLRSDEQVTMHIRVSSDNETRKIWKIETASEKELEKIKNQTKGSLSTRENEITYQEYTEKKMIKTIIEYEDHYEINYKSIYNGKNYEIDFESYDIENKEETIEEIEGIIETFTYTKEEEKPSPFEADWIKVLLIVILVIGLGGVIYEIIKTKKK